MQPIRLIILIVACLTPQVARSQDVPDRLRECALAARVAMPVTDSDTAPSPQRQGEAQAKVREFQASMSQAEFDECVLLSWVGFDHAFVPATYVLGPGRGIDLTLRGATIVDEGKSTLYQWGFLREGARFLPSRYSGIATTGPDGPRHFVEVFVWTPSQPRRDTWQLTWHAFEVAGSELIPVTAERLLTVTAPQPPNASALDVLSMVAIQLNDAGRVEWRVGQNADAQHQVIASPAEQRAHAQQAQRRKAADDQVQWNRVGDIRRRPTLTYADADGCGLAVVYGWSDDRMEVINVQANAELLQLSATPQTFDIARQLSALTLTVHVYGRPVRSLPFCTDVFSLPAAADAQWRAIAGLITIEMVPTIDISGEPRQRATIRLTNAIFENSEGVRVTQTQPVVLTAVVGWLAG